MLITVLDYNTASTWIFKIPNNVEDVEEHLKSLGYDLDNSYWMETRYINLEYDEDR